MAKKKRYNYVKKRIARGGAGALTAATLSLLLFTAAVGISVKCAGQGPLWVGALGACSVLALCWALGLGVHALFDEGKNYIPAKLALVLAVLQLILWLFILLWGKL